MHLPYVLCLQIKNSCKTHTQIHFKLWQFRGLCFFESLAAIAFIPEHFSLAQKATLSPQEVTIILSSSPWQLLIYLWLIGMCLS